VHLLLPPSEGKTAGGRGRPLARRTGDAADAPAGPGAALVTARRTVLDALDELVGGDPAAAAAALLLPPGLADEALTTNRAVLRSPTTPALRRYAGVVYEGLDFSGLNAAEQRVAGRTIQIFSGLFGVVRGDEPVPSYRVPAKATLPGIGVLATFWRPVLREVLSTVLRRGLLVDLRSSDYAAMWRASRSEAERVVTVRVLSPLPAGGHGIVSYRSKFAKGRLAAELIRRIAAGAPVEAPADVVAAWSAWDGAAGAETTATGLDLYTR
jgi:cytoplasmic iron level regulating protein YaaA (DUF328/UPF0246 family)